jgi:hypothetical protein
VLVFILEQRLKSQQKDDVRVHTGLPPSVEGPIYAILICHIPKLRWLARHQFLCRSVTVKVTWWGEDETSAIFKYVEAIRNHQNSLFVFSLDHRHLILHLINDNNQVQQLNTTFALNCNNFPDI